MKARIGLGRPKHEISDEKKFFDLNLKLEYEAPNDYLYGFTGTLTLDDKKIALTNSNFLLRGMSLQDTDYVVAMVAYNGHDTKVM